MKVAMHHVAAALILTGGTMSVAASAEPLFYSFVPFPGSAATLTFEADSNPFAVSTNGLNYNVPITNYMGFQPAGPLITSAFFRHDAFRGGLDVGPFFLGYGSQLFTSAPSGIALKAGNFRLVDRFNQNTLGTLTVSNIAAAVPEPSTWAMMLVGFAAAGAMLRRRKTKVSTTVVFA